MRSAKITREPKDTLQTARPSSYIQVLNMVVVAVAGGTGDVGRTMIEELKKAPKFKIVLLTRQVSCFSN